MAKGKNGSKRRREEVEEDDEDLSSMREKDIVAIGVSDLHLSHKSPIARSREEDWYECMAHPLAFLRELSNTYEVPVLYAGDIFDHWDQPPQLLSFALDSLPLGYAVPGQHDLPNHSYEEIKRSAYWTMVSAGRIRNLRPDKVLVATDRLALVGFPWGHPLDRWDNMGKPSDRAAAKKKTKVAVLHSYVWMQNYKFPGASEAHYVGKYQTTLKGFHAAIFGDNHKGFSCMTEDEDEPWVGNCGNFMRRRLDEKGSNPQVFLIHKSGHLIPAIVPQQTTDEQWMDPEEVLTVVEAAFNGADFLDELMGLGHHVANFVDVLTKFCKKHGVAKKTQDIILSALEESK